MDPKPNRRRRKLPAIPTDVGARYVGDSVNLRSVSSPSTVSSPTHRAHADESLENGAGAVASGRRKDDEPQGGNDDGINIISPLYTTDSLRISQPPDPQRLVNTDETDDTGAAAIPGTREDQVCNDVSSVGGDGELNSLPTPSSEFVVDDSTTVMGIVGEPLWTIEQAEWTLRHSDDEPSRVRLKQWLKRGRPPSRSTQSRFVERLNDLVQQRDIYTGYREVKQKLVAEFGRTVFGHASSIVTAALAKADVSSEPTIAPAVSEGLPSSKTRPSDSLKKERDAMMRVLRVLCDDASGRVTYLHLKTTLVQQFGRHAFARHKPELQQFISEQALGKQSVDPPVRPSTPTLEAERAACSSKLKKLWQKPEPDQAEEARLVQRMSELRSIINSRTSLREESSQDGDGVKSPGKIHEVQSVDDLVSRAEADQPEKRIDCFEFISDSILAKILCRECGVDVIFNCSKVSRRWRRVIATLVCGIRLDLSWAKSRLTDTILRRIILPRIGPLGAIILKDCFQITDGACAVIAEHSPKLTTLVLDGCPQVGENGITSIALRCPKLETASLVGLNLPETAVVRLADNCRQLRRLHLATGESRPSQMGMNAAVSLAAHCQALRSLDLSHSPLINEEVLRLLVAGCIYLEELRMANCLNLVDSGLVAIIPKLSFLRLLDLSLCSRLTDISMACIAAQCPSLDDLIIAGCMDITDVGIVALAKHPRLTALKLTGCMSVTDIGISALAQYSLVTQLDISQCPAITNNSLVSFAQANSKCSLVSMCMSACDQLSDAGIDALIAVYHPKLHSLDLGYCLLLSAEIISSLARCNRLDNLVLTGCANVSDAAVLNIVKCCHDLRILRLGYCRKLTSQGVAALLAASQNLEELAVDFCPQVGQVALDAVQTTNRPSRLFSLLGIPGLVANFSSFKGVRVLIDNDELS